MFGPPATLARGNAVYMQPVLFYTGAITAFIYGIVVGSFLNVCIYRLPLGESLTTPPSHCPTCNNRLRPVDLVPLFSFLALRGKCRYCGTRISWRYFTIEFITGLLFTACWVSLALRFSDLAWTLGGLVLVATACIWAAAMLVTFVIDLETTYVFEPVTWVAMGAGLINEVTLKYLDPARWTDGYAVAYRIGGVTIPYLPAAVPGMVIGFLVFVGMDLFGRLIFRKPSMGLGDAYIGAAIGALLGPGLALLSFGIAIMLGAVVGVVLIALGALFDRPAPGSEKAETEGPMQETDDDVPQGRYMPFGPFLTGSAVAVALAPEWFLTAAGNLWQWYRHVIAA